MDDISTYKFLKMHFCFEELKAPFDADFVLAPSDRAILRELARRTAEFAADPVNEVRRRQWSRMNTLKAEKPMVWINEVCWHEMNVDEELTLRTVHPFCRQLEAELRQQIYQWVHMPCDMVIEPVILAPLVITNSGIGLSKEMDFIKTDERNDVVSRHFLITIRDEEDLEKIRYPEIRCDRHRSDLVLSHYHEIFDGILRVEQRGAPGFWFAPWDDIVMHTGVQEVLLDLAMRPDYIRKMMEKFVEVGVSVLDQYEQLGLLSRNDTTTRVGSGGYGCVDDMPASPQTGPVRASHLWGCCAAQVFAGVSPEMHEEFALQYERRWLHRFGLTYYGCCEPLHLKIDQFRTIRNLRKISISPFADLAAAKEAIANDYVISYKPSPSIFAFADWNKGEIKAELGRDFSLAQGGSLEVIMKDISTVHYQPKRLWDWARMASDLTR